MDQFWLFLAAKMVASATLVVAASFVAERLGPFLSAIVATLPISAGPAYIFLAMEHGPDFIEKSSVISLAMNAATAVFIVAYAFLAQSHSVLPSLAGALLVWFGLACFIIQIPWSLVHALALNTISFSFCIFVARRIIMKQPPQRKPPEARWWDIPSRALGVMMVVGAVVVVGRFIGATAAGIAATMPIVLTSLALILQPRLGGPTAALVLVNGLPGMIGMALALVMVHASAVLLGSASALSLALVICILWNTGLILLRRKFS